MRGHVFGERSSACEDCLTRVLQRLRGTGASAFDHAFKQNTFPFPDLTVPAGRPRDPDNRVPIST